jgi:hypothetical protein
MVNIWGILNLQKTIAGYFHYFSTVQECSVIRATERFHLPRRKRDMRLTFNLNFLAGQIMMLAWNLNCEQACYKRWTVFTESNNKTAWPENPYHSRRALSEEQKNLSSKCCRVESARTSDFNTTEVRCWIVKPSFRVATEQVQPKAGAL